LQRVRYGPAALTAREALEMATLGGAEVLNRKDIGALAVGMAADIAVFDLNTIAFAGARHDPTAALVFCNSVPAAYTLVGGRVIVRDGQLTSLDMPHLVERHNSLASALVTSA